MVGLTAAVTVTSPRAAAYGQWRELEGLPAFMAHLDEVTQTGPRTSHWRAAAPFGRTVEWDARITEDLPGERIAWQSVEGSKVRSEGEVRFTPAPGGQDTEVHVMLRYSAPGSPTGSRWPSAPATARSTSRRSTCGPPCWSSPAGGDRTSASRRWAWRANTEPGPSTPTTGPSRPPDIFKNKRDNCEKVVLKP